MYTQSLIARGIVTQAEAQAIVDKEHKRLSDLYSGQATKRPQVDTLHGCWEGYLGGPDTQAVPADTGVARALLEKITDRLAHVPEGFVPHAKIQRLFEQRSKMGHGEARSTGAWARCWPSRRSRWEGTLVRMSGQDSRRGTFSHRHCRASSTRTPRPSISRSSTSTRSKARCKIYDSPLSEAGVLGFEYGYSLDYPDGLVIWEAQFGDFVNGAQVIIDQFITSSEDKWQRLSGLVLLLPHGYEGQGPEHSSARFERFLSSAPRTTSRCASRRRRRSTSTSSGGKRAGSGASRSWSSRRRACSACAVARSSLSELTDGKFHRILGDTEIGNPAAVHRVLLCTGKVYYDLVEERKKQSAEAQASVAILRLEQLYPLKQGELIAALATYPEREGAGVGAGRAREHGRGALHLCCDSCSSPGSRSVDVVASRRERKPRDRFPQGAPARAGARSCGRLLGPWKSWGSIPQGLFQIVNRPDMRRPS